MKLSAETLARLAQVEKDDLAYKEARIKLESELRIQLKEKLSGLEWTRARSVRDAHTSMIKNDGRANIAAISRAIHSTDHNTAKAILAMTDDVADIIAKQDHPDDKLIGLDRVDPAYYHLKSEDGTKKYKFKLVRGEYVGVSPTEADELDQLNAVERIKMWEERNKNDE